MRVERSTLLIRGVHLGGFSAVVPATIVDGLLAVHRPIEEATEKGVVLRPRDWNVSTVVSGGLLVTTVTKYTDALRLARRLVAYRGPWLTTQAARARDLCRKDSRLMAELRRCGALSRVAA